MVVQRKSVLVGLLALGAVLACVLAFGVSSGTSATKSPIKIGLVGDIVSPTQSFKQSVQAVQARFKAVNAAGGINGRQVQVTTCDAKSDPNVGAACAQKLVKDKVVAVVSPFSVAGGSMQPVFSKAKIPVVGLPLLPIAYTDKYSYLSLPGLVETFTATGQYAAEKGCRKAGVIASAIGAYQAAATNAKKGFTSKGGQIVNEQSPAAGAPDYTPYVQAVINAGATCLLHVVPTTDTAKLLTAIKQSSKPNLLIVATETAYTGLKLGSLGNGSIGTASTNPPSSYPKSVTADRNKYAKSTKFDTYFTYGYAAAKVLEAGLRGVKGAVTSASIVKSLNTLRSIDPVVAPKFSYRGLPFANPTYARIASTKVNVYELQNDKSVLRKTIDVGAALRAR